MAYTLMMMMTMTIMLMFVCVFLIVYSRSSGSAIDTLLLHNNVELLVVAGALVILGIGQFYHHAALAHH